MQIFKRYEKGQKFLDLCKLTQRELDDDGKIIENECRKVFIWDNEDPNYDQHHSIEFTSKGMALLFIRNNNWEEQE